jgi:hypothetical protein
MEGSRMDQDHKKEIEEIIGGFECPQDLKCCKQGFENLCKAQDTGLETFLECLEQRPDDCPFSLSFGGMFLCECPLRVYMAKELKK